MPEPTTAQLLAEVSRLRNRIEELEREVADCGHAELTGCGDASGEITALAVTRGISKRRRSDSLLKALSEGTASSTGEDFFPSFVRALATVFGSRYLLVCEHLDSPVTRVRTVAFWQGDHLAENVEYDLAGGPCEETAGGEMTFFPSGLQALFPRDRDLVELNADSYCGIPLFDHAGQVIGHLAIMDDGPMERNLCEVPMLGVFVSRAAAELERKRSETEARRLHEKLAQASRLSTMGEMATGLAHELNQPLAAISSYAFAGEQLLSSSEPVDPQRLRELFSKLVEQAVRSGEIIRRLRSLVGRRNAARSRVRAADLIAEVIQLLEATLRKSQVRVDLYTDPQLSDLVVDEVQIQQVLVNLVHNALDAMSDTASGQRTLSITSSRPRDDLVEIAVRDAGAGIPAQDRGQVFDAFFTTKAEGMGMGLAISRTIIESHGGRLWMTPNPQRGVTFRMTLPGLSPDK